MAAEKSEADAEESPFAVIKKRLSLYRFYSLLGILISVGLFGGSVAVVVYSGIQSMSAFESLPKFQVNSLVLEFRTLVGELDQSMASTREALDGTDAQFTLYKSRRFSQQLLLGEQAFDQVLQHYGEVMALASDQVGGALEWNRYFQTDIQALRDQSTKRQEALKAIFEQFPQPAMDFDQPEDEDSEQDNQ